jgi:hypothetical protein
VWNFGLSITPTLIKLQSWLLALPELQYSEPHNTVRLLPTNKNPATWNLQSVGAPRNNNQTPGFWSPKVYETLYVIRVGNYREYQFVKRFVGMILENLPKYGLATTQEKLAAVTLGPSTSSRKRRAIVSTTLQNAVDQLKEGNESAPPLLVILLPPKDATLFL